MLALYQRLTRRLLNDAGFAQFNDFDFADYINQARLQVAAQGRCIRQYVTLSLVAAQRVYPFSAITGLSAGVGGIYHIRQAWYQIPGTIGQVSMISRPFEWFGQYALNNPVPPQGQPARWTQFGQGEQGSIFVDPIPDGPYSVMVDVLGVPVPLATDATVEAIPDIWTLAVPFYAAWWAMQSALRQEDADKMMQRYQEQMRLARSAANPDLLEENWSQTVDPEQANRLGVQQTRQ